MIPADYQQLRVFLFGNGRRFPQVCQRIGKGRAILHPGSGIFAPKLIKPVGAFPLLCRGVGRFQVAGCQ